MSLLLDVARLLVHKLEMMTLKFLCVVHLLLVMQCYTWMPHSW